ncbi:hypothetical protein [Mesorhizobium xinjiangense]|uniref:hypothetical protein n=1 Tax=Mesorhizobium xinjiangense TaxID=2678685 RepID=UPI0012EDA926|nr:hypothetical protein [Mesorhizobium xinjiangense]
MRYLLSGLILIIASMPVNAEEVYSAYTDLVPEKDCAVFAAPPPGEGDWYKMICAGWRGYPVQIDYSDVRASAYFGFPRSSDLALPWESFVAFNTFGKTIEWRIRRQGNREEPYATILRWFVGGADEGDTTEVLVVERVGWHHFREGCAVGLVVATGNPDANAMARKMADEETPRFACGADQPLVVGADGVHTPEFSRVEP